MDKNAIKKYAVWARRELIEKVTQKALQYGIEEGKELDPNLDSINGVLLSDVEKSQRKVLINKIKEENFSTVIEEVAYTWFNRFVALRFMEVNGYLPSHVRVFTDENDNFKPQILTEALHLDFSTLDKEQVISMKQGNKDEELFKYLLITQCNELNAILPKMFERLSDYTELLLPDFLLRAGSVIHRMVTEIDGRDFDVNNENGGIEIIGWMYQYYNLEKKESVINIKKGAVGKNDIPAATQIFTTEWVVRYIVDNSLGKYWIENSKQSDLDKELEYYVKNIDEKKSGESISPDSLTVLDPCVGSGHFLVYAFDVLMKIYSECGYSEKDAAAEIVKNNLFGLDIDERAAQLAYFALMMKARKYDRRFFARNVQANIFAFKDSSSVDDNTIEYFAGGNNLIKSDVRKLLSAFENAKEYGSLIDVGEHDWDELFKRMDAIKNDIHILQYEVDKVIVPIIRIGRMLSRKYSVVITNPPYLNKMDTILKGYLADNYKDFATDLFSVFIKRNLELCEKNGYSGYMTPNVWMFLTSYEPLRNYLIENKNISSLIQIAKGAFYKEATVDICAFVVRNSTNDNEGTYIRLEDFKGDMDVQNEYLRKILIDGEYTENIYTVNSREFLDLPGSQIAFWVGKEIYEIFVRGKKLGDIAKPRQGMATSDNNRFLRLWHEVNYEKIGFDFEDAEAACNSGKRWFPYNKGGAYRKWYGNNEYLVDYENDGERVKAYAASLYKSYSRTIKNINFYFKPCITWTMISSSRFGVRYSPQGFVFDIRGSSIFFDDNKKLNYILAFLSSTVTWELLKFLSPTISFEVGTIAQLPVIWNEEYSEELSTLVQENICLSKSDWDSYETSWDFKASPLIGNYKKIGDAFNAWEKECTSRREKMRKNEERINHIFIEIYGLGRILNAEVDYDDITIPAVDKETTIKDFISYSVGCMLGRFSLSEEGILDNNQIKYALDRGDKYLDEDGIIPISDDEYFNDDIVVRFIDFMRCAYGDEFLEENLSFIAEAIGGKGNSRQVLRNYFLNNFYKDHCKRYQKRPIYWLFDSGKKNGFKCLISMHRYQADTIARIRTNYVHEIQSRYRVLINEYQKRISELNGSEKVKAEKLYQKVKDQDEELFAYEEKIHHYADKMIPMDLDDGVKKNYSLFEEILAKIK
ncbi:Methyltransferase domain-containing protein [Lachnospiraceae bacterium C7]|nr:Methyltransferase domain-containing protein [Lachnospiraceae bacterium C7]